MTVQALFKQAQQMNAKQRAKLAEMLMESIADDAEVSPEMHAELDRRIDYMEKHPDAWIPWEKVKAELKARRQKRCAR